MTTELPTLPLGIKKSQKKLFSIDSKTYKVKKKYDLGSAKTRAGFTKSAPSAKNNMKPIFFISPSFSSQKIDSKKSV